MGTNPSRIKVDAVITESADAIAAMPGETDADRRAEFLARVLSAVVASVGPHYHGNLSNAVGNVRNSPGTYAVVSG